MLGSTSIVLRFNFLVSSFIRPILSSSNWRRLWEELSLELKSKNLRGSPEMSGAPSASRRPPSVVVEDASLSRVSSGTSYRPSRDSREPQGNAGGVVTGRTSVIPSPPQQPIPLQQPTLPQRSATPQQPAPLQNPAPSRHTNPHQVSAVRPDERATSRRLVPEQPNRGGARRSLAYSTKSSQT